MTIQQIRATREGKFFYRNSFRRVVLFLIISLVINGLLVFGIYNKLINKIEPRFYATSGVKPPIKLTAMSHPNYKSTALLPPDPVTDDNEKMLSK